MDYISEGFEVQETDAGLDEHGQMAHHQSQSTIRTYRSTGGWQSPNHGEKRDQSGIGPGETRCLDMRV